MLTPNQDKKIRFSIVIPTFNGERYIAQTIESVLAQTRQPDEIIISDDNSSDSTLEICLRYDAEVKIFTNPSGPSGFVNGWKRAVSLASGDFISILHQDDLLYPDFLREIERAVTDNPDVKHFFTPCNIIDANGIVSHSPIDYCSGATHRFSGKDYAEAYERVKGHIHRCPGVVTHRDIFKSCNYRTEAGHIADDDFFLRVGNYTDIVGVLKPLAAYREHSASETGHLSFFKLNRRLLDDYHFQLSHSNQNPLLSPYLLDLFKHRETQYIHRLIVFGIKRGHFKDVLYALRKWLSFDNRFGNIRYDLGRVPELLKHSIRNLNIRYLCQRSKKYT